MLGELLPDVVQIIPLDSSPHNLILLRHMISFCRNLSAGGCALLHNRLLPIKELVVFSSLISQTGRIAMRRSEGRS